LNLLRSANRSELAEVESESGSEVGFGEMDETEELVV